MTVSLIISYYKNIENLELILNELNKQSCSDFEVIVSEDDNDAETKSYLENKIADCNFSLNHLTQAADNGFRKNEMLNKSVLATTNESIVFIDGDCIPHKHFIKEYRKRIKSGAIFYGRRVMLSEKLTNKLLRNIGNQKLKFFPLFGTGTTKKKEALYFPYVSLMVKERGLVGCNWGIKKKHLMEVNGFDEDYIRAGYGEDSDIEWRLRRNGLKMKSMKNRSIVFHLHHARSYSDEGLRFNHQLMLSKQAENRIECLNGLSRLK